MLLVAQLAGCAKPAPEEVEPLPPLPAVDEPRPDLLWAFDLSDRATERMTAEELWQIGAECRLWPADMPAGTAKAAVIERLMQEKYRHVGDFPAEDG